MGDSSAFTAEDNISELCSSEEADLLCSHKSTRHRDKPSLHQRKGIESILQGVLCSRAADRYFFFSARIFLLETESCCHLQQRKNSGLY